MAEGKSRRSRKDQIGADLTFLEEELEKLRIDEDMELSGSNLEELEEWDEDIRLLDKLIDVMRLRVMIVDISRLVSSSSLPEVDSIRRRANDLLNLIACESMDEGIEDTGFLDEVSWWIGKLRSDSRKLSAPDLREEQASRIEKELDLVVEFVEARLRLDEIDGLRKEIGIRRPVRSGFV